MIGWWRAGEEQHREWLELILAGDREIQELEQARRQAREHEEHPNA